MSYFNRVDMWLPAIHAYIIVFLLFAFADFHVIDEIMTVILSVLLQSGHQSVTYITCCNLLQPQSECLHNL